MADEVGRFQKLKKRADKLRAEVSRAEGALEQLTNDLRERYQCDTLKEAKAKRSELADRKERLEAEFAEQLDLFEAAMEKVEDA